MSMKRRQKTMKRPTAKVMLASDWMPRRRPREMDTVATTVMTQMMVILFSSVTSMSELSLLSPVVIELTPKPRDVHTPKVVHAMDSA